MKRIKAMFTAVLVLIVTVFYSPPQNVLAASSMMLSINYDHIRSVGSQILDGNACACYAWAYVRTICDGYVHNWYEFNSGNGQNEYDTCCLWNGAREYDRLNAQSDAFRLMYDQLCNHRPVCVYVKSINPNKTQGHWVTVVGYENFTGYDNLGTNNFYIIDPAASNSLSSPIKLSSKYLLQTYGDGKYNLRCLKSGNVPVVPITNTNPSQPTLTVSAGNSATDTTFKWNSCANATHYDLRVFNSSHHIIFAVGQCDDAIKYGVFGMYSKLSYQKKLDAGTYYATVASVNNATGEFAFSNEVAFTVGSAEPEKKYVTVKFDCMGGYQRVLAVGEKYGELPMTLPNGRVVTKWYTSGTMTNETRITEDTIVSIETDHWIYPRSYESDGETGMIYFDAEEGDCEVRSMEVINQVPFGDLPTATRYGYEFVGWIEKPEGVHYATPTIGPAQLVKKDRDFGKTYYPLWRPIETTVTYDPTIGKVYYGERFNEQEADTYSMKIKFDQTYGFVGDYPYGIDESPFAWTDDGYKFIGWFTEPEGGTQIVSHDICKSITDQTLYAHWEAYDMEISFHLGEGFSNVDDWIIYTSNNTTINSLPAPSRPGYLFNGWWYTTINGERKQFTEGSVCSYFEIDSRFLKLEADWIESQDAQDKAPFVYFLNDDGVSIVGVDHTAEHVEVPDTLNGKPVVCIDDGAFSGCKNISSITIPESVTCIGDYAFNDCSGLKDITIPESVTSIGWQAFESTAWIDAARKQDQLVVVDGILIDGRTCVGDVVIPNEVKKIGAYAFSNNEDITSITIPGSVKIIDECAFIVCTKLKTVSIESGVEEIGTGAFSGCKALSELIIPNTVVSIGDNPFECYDLEKDKSTYIPLKVYAETFAEQYASDQYLAYEVIEEPVIIDGDMDGDGTVTESDAILLIRFISEDESLTDAQVKTILEANPDRNADGFVTIVDMRLLMQEANKK